MINFEPRQFTNHLPQGTYQGYVEQLQYFEDKGYFTMNILIGDQIFNTALSDKSIIMHKYLFNFVNAEQRKIDETQIIDTQVKFSVVDNKKSGELKSRVTALEPVYED